MYISWTMVADMTLDDGCDEQNLWEMEMEMESNLRVFSLMKATAGMTYDLRNTTCTGEWSQSDQGMTRCGRTAEWIRGWIEACI